MDRITEPGVYRITRGANGEPVAEPLDDGSGHPLPPDGFPVVFVRGTPPHLTGYQTSERLLEIPGGQFLEFAREEHLR